MKKSAKPKPTRSLKPNGLFITFEGIEGSGKSTQCRSLAEWFRLQGYQVLETREPGGTKLAEKLRACLLDRMGESVHPWTEALIVYAARNQHVRQVIRPALDMGAVVLCDRFIDSTLAYQGFGRGLDVKTLCRMHDQAGGGLRPDLTFVFDMSVDAALQRRHHNQLAFNRLDAESLAFHERVRRGFRTLARREPRRIRLLGADRPADVISRDVESLVRERLRTRRPSARRSRA